MNKNVKIYVGCALTHADESFRKEVRGFKDDLKKEGFNILDFLWDKISNPEKVIDIEKEVYKWDIKDCVGGCDLFLAICDKVSLGLGYEIGTAVEKYGKPVLAVAKEGVEVTRLIRGVTHSNFSFKYYKNFSDLKKLLKEKIKESFN